MRYLKIYISLLLIVVYLFGGITISASELEPIKIGTVYPRSGPLAYLGENAWIGCEVVRRIVNEDGGINGREVVFINADAPDTQAATTETERLISQHGVEIIIGSYSSANALAVSAVTERNRVLLWENQGIVDELTQRGFKYLFRCTDTGGGRGKRAVDFIVEELCPLLNISKGEIRVAAVTEDSSYGEALSQGFMKRAKELGVNVITHERYSSTSTDLSPTIHRLIDSKADVVFAVSYVNDAILFWNQAMQYGADFKAFITGGAGWIEAQFAEVQGKKADGILIVSNPTNLGFDVYEDDKIREMTKRCYDLYKEMTGKDSIPQVTDESLGGTYVLFYEVLPKAGPLYDADSIIEVARNIDIKETIGLAWPFKFDETGQNTGALPVIHQWENGETKIVWPPKYSVKEITNIPIPVFKK